MEYRIKDLESKLGNLQKDNDKLKNLIPQLENSLREKDDKIRDLENMLKNLRDKLANMENQLNQERDKNNKLSMEFKLLNEKADRGGKDADQLKDKLAESMNELKLKI